LRESLLRPLSASFRRGFMLFLLLLGAAFLLAWNSESAKSAVSDAAGAADPAAVEAAKRYLHALASGDKKSLRLLTPKRLANFYGPCLFKEMPALSNPRVKGHRGLIDFEGKSTDPALPSQGTIALTLRDSRKFDRWQVRAVIWKGGSSLSLNPFEYSSTEADRIQEGQVRASATKYLCAWLQQDWATMDHLTYDWLNRKKPMKGEFYIRSLALESALRPEGSVRVEFTARISPRLPLIGLFRHTARGLLYMVKEEGEWKVRGMTAAL